MIGLAGIGIGMLVPIVVFGPALATAALGPSWTDAGRYAQVLAPAFALQLAVSPFAQTMAVLGGHRTQLVWDLVRAGGILAALALSSIGGATALQTVIAVTRGLRGDVPLAGRAHPAGHGPFSQRAAGRIRVDAGEGQLGARA